MPAYLPNQNVLAIKCLGFYDDNPKKKIPALNAQIMLLNSSTGTLLAVSRCQNQIFLHLFGGVEDALIENNFNSYCCNVLHS